MMIGSMVYASPQKTYKAYILKKSNLRPEINNNPCAIFVIVSYCDIILVRLQGAYGEAYSLVVLETKKM